jgi:hypothetical protein
MPILNFGEPMEAYAKRRKSEDPEAKDFKRIIFGGQRKNVLPVLPNQEAWFQWGVGITEAGQGVSVWADQSGNGRDLLQGTDGARPPKQTDGSILFNGTDEFLKCSGFTLNQPTTVYLVAKQVTWTDLDGIFDGDAIGSGLLRQRTASPRLQINAGSDVSEAVGGWTVDTYAVIAVIFNGADSLIRVNASITASGDAGAGNMGGFTLGVYGDGTTNPGNIQVKEVLLYSGAHTTLEQDGVINYLMTML